MEGVIYILEYLVVAQFCNLDRFLYIKTVFFFVDRRNDKLLEIHIHKVEGPRFEPLSWHTTLVIRATTRNIIFCNDFFC
jgi:hypothetical protein